MLVTTEFSRAVRSHQLPLNFVACLELALDSPVMLENLGIKFDVQQREDNLKGYVAVSGCQIPKIGMTGGRLESSEIRVFPFNHQHPDR
jgi:hypothetical protein